MAAVVGSALSFTSSNYRISQNVRIELIYSVTAPRSSDHTSNDGHHYHHQQHPAPGFGPDGGLRSISFTNFTGRIVIHQEEAQHKQQHDRVPRPQQLQQQYSSAPMDEESPASTLVASLALDSPSNEVDQGKGSSINHTPNPFEAIGSWFHNTAGKDGIIKEPKSKSNDTSIGKALESPSTISINSQSTVATTPKAHATVPSFEAAVNAVSALGHAGTAAMSGHSDRGSSNEGKRPALLTKQVGGIIQAAVKTLASKKRCPESIRQRRRNLHSYASFDQASPSTTNATTNTATGPSSFGANQLQIGGPPTPLHDLCAREYVTVEELFGCLEKFPDAIRTKDAQGRFPLHILGDNETLVVSPQGRQTATIFAEHLIHEYVPAATAQDANGNLPFFTIVEDWIDWANNRQDEDNDYTARMSLEYNSSYYPGATSNRRLNFPRVEMWNEADWCFSMLSTVIDILAKNRGLPRFQKTRQLLSKKTFDEGTRLIEHLVGKMPLIFPTVLLIDDDGVVDSRARTLELPLFRKILLCEILVDSWLVEMLNHGGIPARRAVDFLCMASKTTVDDYTGGYGAAHPSDWAAFNELREEVFLKVEGLKGTMPSLVTLDEKELERAASAPIVWHAMNNRLSRPFVLSLFLIDLVLHFTLMLAFRDFAGAVPGIPESPLQEDDSIAYYICAHYFLRQLCEAWAMHHVSRRALRGFLFDMWNIFDFMSITLILVTMSAENTVGSFNGLNSFVIGLLWIKILAFLKVVNKEMSIFIVAMGQILTDIRYFMFVLLVYIFMFGDMFHIAIGQKDDGEYCEATGDAESGTIEDFCSSSWESYLRVYSILLGDFELDDITTTAGSTVLFVIFTMFGVVILLNVLIAVISDSYEKARIRGHVLFGKARVMFVAQNQALENFLRPRKRRLNPEQVWWNRAKTTGRWLILGAVLGSALCTLLFLIGTCISMLKRKDERREIVYFCVAMGLSIVLTAALWVTSSFVLDEAIRYVLPENAERVYDKIGQFNKRFVAILASVLFGTNQEKVLQISENGDDPDQEWTGKSQYIAQLVGRYIVEAKRELKAEIIDLKNEINEKCIH
eukprot:CAMPEP_0172443676 /NCGR_PEP_ID=MMETSP1065-20121228/3898_1 /TAXON_ID=265537 /ORGANISM="Amphiprora paludosa, Strain CCMP125" /LENGTH=1078 /DNA_ID=CAMNT_0013193991 /DNA_START=22 /DNA_END=3258 /DNA_ORIENTATION=+